MQAPHQTFFPTSDGTQRTRSFNTQTMAIKATLKDTESPDEIVDICNYIQTHTTYRPLIGIICGSGLSGLSRFLQNPDTIHYTDIPYFPHSTVSGHTGELVFGDLEGISVVCMRGRFHTYEGYDIQTTTLPVRVMALLGVKTLIVTNAAGGLNENYRVGDIMIIADHFNFPGCAGKHPLVGPNDERFGERFTALSECYDKTLQKLAYAAAYKVGVQRQIRKGGMYCFVSGPTYETRAEARFLRMIGGDSVGMSTVPEVIVATHCGMKVLGLSLITNAVVQPGSSGIPASHEEVLDAVQAAASQVEDLVRQIIHDIHDGQESAIEEAQVHKAEKILVARRKFLGVSLVALSLALVAKLR